MKNIHVLLTPNPSRLYTNMQGILSKDELKMRLKNQTIYITSDEEIKEGEENEWYYDTNFNKITKWIGESNTYVNRWFKKIILTTDQDLIKDGVQSIDDEFLEWFVKNPSCEGVELNKNYNRGNGKYYYKIIIPKEESKQEVLWIGKNNTSDGVIIIPKEEPKKKHIVMLVGDKVNEEPKQETLEEVAERLAIESVSKNLPFSIVDFTNGYKLAQERSYSEEEVIDILVEFSAELKNISNITKWFEQFKKKIRL